jgi:hypothetical protein
MTNTAHSAAMRLFGSIFFRNFMMLVEIAGPLADQHTGLDP